MTATNSCASHPLSIEAHRGEVPGRWLWTVKWLLVVPHVVVLAVLWMVFAALTLAVGAVIGAVLFLVTALFTKANEIEAGHLDEVDAGIGVTRR